MLTHLSIRDFAIIDQLEVAFESGFTVLTGETGAGKSILINALHLLLGGRASEDMIRTEASSAEVQGVFELQPGSQALGRLTELEMADGVWLSVRRVIARGGRNRVFVNDRRVSLATLVELTRQLVDISGQHEHVGLTEEASHRGILDDFGDLAPEVERVAKAVAALRASERALSELERQDRQRAERQDYLRFALERIAAVDPQVGEDEALQRERSRLANAERLASGLGQAVGWLCEQDASAVDLLGRASKLLSGLVRFDPGLQELVERLDVEARAVEDLARDVGAAASGLQSDPVRLEQVEQRLQALRGLVRHHGPDLEAVLQARGRLTDELASLERIESRRTQLAQAGQRHRSRALELAGELSAQRQRAAGQMAERMQRELDSLAMPGARFAVQVEPSGGQALDENGFDQVRFLFSANPGEALRPLVRVASGGELSRVLLALKTVLAEVDRVSTYVFDEVDSGVGGAVAEVIGDRLSSLARRHQVLSITHLPQIAVHAEAHLSVTKRVEDGRTSSAVVRLAGREERVEEVARMVGGRQVTEKARGHARELLARAWGQDG